MAYSELIKNFAGIRSYMRQFLVYGFRSRDEFDAKSLRSYDNEKRRVESWLSEYMSFRQSDGGKAVFLTVDSRHIPHNPLYKAWKASGFTKNDISLHFLLMDILTKSPALPISALLTCIDKHYLPGFRDAVPIDESTLRKKLKEYVELGLLVTEKQGRQLAYRLAGTEPDLTAWQHAVAFFAEDNPLGVIGSYLLDKYDSTPDFFSFKHRYWLFALDSEILLALLISIHEHEKIELELAGSKNGRSQRYTVLPLKIYSSVQGGRQYLAAYGFWKKRICFFRLDSILHVKPVETVADYHVFQEILANEQAHIWGVSTSPGSLEHIEMTLEIDPKDIHIAHRLEREKRCGFVERQSDTVWKFSADVYDATELFPWLRTFIGRIISLNCSNKRAERRFWSDLAALSKLYGGDGHALS